MPKMRTAPSLPKARNLIRRALHELVDPSPSTRDIQNLWAYFQDRCAYCDKQLDPANREGHCDHLDSSTTGGHNGIGNRVLACGECNGDEKREASWKDFLVAKCPDESLRSLRYERIEGWQAKHHSVSKRDAKVEEALHLACSKALGAFNEAVADLRAVFSTTMGK